MVSQDKGLGSPVCGGVGRRGGCPEVLMPFCLLFQEPSSTNSAPGTAHLPHPLSGWFVFRPVLGSKLQPLAGVSEAHLRGAWLV